MSGVLSSLTRGRLAAWNLPAFLAGRTTKLSPTSKYMAVRERLGQFNRPTEVTSGWDKSQTRPFSTSSRASKAPNLSMPPVLFQEISRRVEHRLREAPLEKALRTESSSDIPDDSQIPWRQEDAYQHVLSMLTTVSFSAPIAENFALSGLGLPPLNGAATAHLLCGAEHFIQSLGFKPTFILQYRTALVTQFWMDQGLSLEETFRMIAQSFYSQTRGGELSNPLNNNFFFRSPHPNKLAPPVGNDLGYGPEVASSRALGEGLSAPSHRGFQVITTGDTGPHTGGFFNSLANIAEMHRRGLPYFGVQVVIVNNAAISTQFSESPQQAADKMVEELHLYSGLFDTHQTALSSSKIKDGVAILQTLTRKSIQTGRLQVLVVYTPPRPGGHASDKPLLTAPQLEQLAETWTEHLHSQLCQSAPQAQLSPQQIADLLAQLRDMAKEAVKFALAGSKPLTRPQIHELSSPLHTQARQYSGQIITLEDYFQDRSGPIGTTALGDSLLRLADHYAAAGKKVIVITQENNDPRKGRCGVYGELDLLAQKYPKQIVRLGVNERQQVMTASSMREMSGALVVNMLPHQFFVGHASGALEYTASMRRLETRVESTSLTLFNAGNLAFDATTADGTSYVHARVGQHHNSFNHGQFSNTNTVIFLPPNMSVSAALLPHAMELVEKGVQVLMGNPTRDYGNPQPDLPLPETLSINSILTKKTTGSRTLENGEKLVIVTYGAESSALIQALEDADISAEVVIILSNHTPSSLEALLQGDLKERRVHVVFNDDSLGARFTSEMRVTLANRFAKSHKLTMTTVQPPQGVVPYGNGENLLRPKDLLRHLELNSGLSAPICEEGPTAERVTLERPKKSASRKLIPGGVPAPFSVVLPAGMKASKVTIGTWMVTPGTQVVKGQVLGSFETDKATLEITSPCDGIFAPLVNDGSLTDVAANHYTINPSAPLTIEGDDKDSAIPQAPDWRQDEAHVSWAPLSQTRQAMARNLRGQAPVVYDTINFTNLKQLAAAWDVSITAMLTFLLNRTMNKLHFHRVLSGDMSQMGTVLMPRIGCAVDSGELKTVAVSPGTQSLASMNRQIVSALGRPLTAEEASFDRMTAMITVPGKQGSAGIIPTLPNGVPLILGLGANRAGQAQLVVVGDHGIFTGQELTKLLMEIKLLADGLYKMPRPSIKFRGSSLGQSSEA